MTNRQTSDQEELELYIHIPFCRKKCGYCDFVSFPVNPQEQDGCSRIDRYADALCAEISDRAQKYAGRPVRSVYIGGGTPSVLNEEQITRVVSALNRHFCIEGTHEKRRGLFLQKKIRPRVEFSIECNPGTVTGKKLRTWRSLGINRLSIGLQSTDDADLKALGRIHTYEDFVQTFEQAREAGFDNINIDLMQAIPGQSLNAWKRVLAIAGTWRPEHISAYSLIIEEGTEFAARMEKGLLNLPDEDTEREIYYYTRDFLEKAGYHRYEISNYARPGFECVHNIGYWRRKEYLGLGLHASSLIDNTRWKNTDDLDSYIAGTSSPEEVQQLSRKEQMEEFVMVGLRMTEGISRQEFFDTFGQDFDYTYQDVIGNLLGLHLLETDGDRVRLSDRGIDVSNRVLAEFLSD